VTGGDWADGLLDYRVVDVFTDRAFAGNPLAVVLGADDLSTSQLQVLAREFNLSETVFPMAPTSAGSDADYRLRIFTPSAELPFAGHPSVGAAWVMRSLGRVADGRIVQECGAGLLPLDVAGDWITLTGGTPTLGDPVPAGPALAAVGLADGDLVGDELRWAGTGLEFGYLHVREDAVARCVPDVTAIRALGEAAELVVFSMPAAESVRARVFVPGLGVAEDPATGSAALGLGVWLAAAGRVAADGETSYTVTQGVEMGRPSRLECVVRCEAGRAVECRVAGRVAPVAAGRIRPPSR
jgi:trans-2,3-dihydro-3-hydroxyanthranilate isomerase